MKARAKAQKSDIMDTSDQIEEEEVKIQREVIQVNRDSEDDDFTKEKNVTYTKTIGDALIIAKPGSIIQIAAGIYSESLSIKTPNLILESLEEDGKVVLLSGKRP